MGSQISRTAWEVAGSASRNPVPGCSEEPYQGVWGSTMVATAAAPGGRLIWSRS